MKINPGVLSTIVVAALFAFCLFAGCAQIERAAQEVQYVTDTTPAATQPSTQPTSQPAAAVVIHDVVTVVKTIYPPAGQILGGIGALAGLVGLAAHKLGKKNGQSTATGAISEIIGDVAGFKSPDEPWTQKTQDLLVQLGHVAEAMTNK